jgi:hypothetical protein
MQDLELLRKYAESWNTLDISHVEPYFAEDIIIFSQKYNKIVAQGKKVVPDELQRTMTEIKEAGIKEKIYAEIGFCSEEMVESVELYSRIQKSIPLPRIEIDQPCVLMAQKNKENFISVVVAETENELIKNLFVCGRKIPSPKEAVRTSEYPGLKPLTQQEEEELAEIEKNTIRRHLIWIDASHHEYLRVTKEDLIKLNVWRDLSPFSYGSENYAYLEEDCDAGIFLDAAEDADWTITLETVDLPRFPHVKFKGEKVGRLGDDPRCYRCQEDGEEDCSCPRMTCPVCGEKGECGEETSVRNFSCRHLLVGWENDEFVSSVFELRKGTYNLEINDHEWTEQELETVFDEVLPLYYCFHRGEYSEKSKEFWEVLSELIPEIKSDNFYDKGWEASMYFAKRPDRVVKHIYMLLKKLVKEDKQLNKLLPKK